MRFDSGLGRENDLLSRLSLRRFSLSFRGRKRNVALAAIATSLATLTAMICARILGAIDADLAGWLSADAAGEDCGLGYHLRTGFPEAGVAGCFTRISRQR